MNLASVYSHLYYNCQSYQRRPKYKAPGPLEMCMHLLEGRGFYFFLIDFVSAALPCPFLGVHFGCNFVESVQISKQLSVLLPLSGDSAGPLLGAHLPKVGQK